MVSSDRGRSARTKRLPTNYQTVLHAILGLEPGEHVSAQVLYERLRARSARIGFTTVHRALARLHARHEILKIEIPGAEAAIYEPVAPPHAHFRCLACGRIEDVAFTLTPSDLGAICSRHGIDIAAESVTFAGRCAACLDTHLDREER